MSGLKIETRQQKSSTSGLNVRRGITGSRISSGEAGVNGTIIDSLDKRAYSPKRRPDTFESLYRAIDRLASLLDGSVKLNENVPRGYYLDILV